MKRTSLVIVALLCAAAFIWGPIAGGRADADVTVTSQPTRLGVLWTSGDADVAHRVCFMYTHAAKRNNWFDEVILIVWGPSARLLAGDRDLQKKVQDMKQDGVTVLACIACANSYGVTENLRDQGIEVKGMGKPLSDMLQDGWKVLTF